MDRRIDGHIIQISYIFLLGVVLIGSGFCVQQNILLIRSSKHYNAISILPSSLFFMSILVWFLQPDFSPLEVHLTISHMSILYISIVCLGC